MEQSYPQDLALFAELHDEATASRGAAVGDGEAVTGVVAESLDTPTIARGWRAMVGKDEVVIDGGGQVATAHWRASWSECVRRFWVRHDIVRDSGTECDRYRLVVDDGKDTRNAAVLADLGSEENALALLGQIHAGVSRALEMPDVSGTRVFERASPGSGGGIVATEAPVATESILRRALVGMGRGLRVAGVAVGVIGCVCALAFAVPASFHAGQHFSDQWFGEADHERVANAFVPHVAPPPPWLDTPRDGQGEALPMLELQKRAVPRSASIVTKDREYAR
jgi:hypothetical protein